MSEKIVDKVRMIGEWLFVRHIPNPEEEKGIILPNQPRSQKGEVVALSNNGDTNIEKGDVVLFVQRAGFKNIDLDGEKLLVMKKEQIMGVMFGTDAIDVTPTKDYVFLEWELAHEFYHNTSIIRPDSHKERHYTGIIVAIGPDVKEIKVGDRVFFDQFCGVEKLQENEKRYAMIKEGDVYCTGVPKREEVIV